MGFIISRCRREEIPTLRISGPIIVRPIEQDKEGEITVFDGETKIDHRTITLSELKKLDYTRQNCLVLSIRTGRDDLFRELVDESKIIKGIKDDDKEVHEGEVKFSANLVRSVELKNILTENAPSHLIAYYIKTFPRVISEMSHDLIQYILY